MKTMDSSLMAAAGVVDATRPAPTQDYLNAMKDGVSTKSTQVVWPVFNMYFYRPLLWLSSMMEVSFWVPMEDLPV